MAEMSDEMWKSVYEAIVNEDNDETVRMRRDVFYYYFLFYYSFF